MSFFRKSLSIEKSGILKGYTDYHCHILPGVDDGVASVEDSLAVLSEYERAGIVSVWFTPHIMEDIPNTTLALRKRFEELRAVYRGPVELHLASENMLDPIFPGRLAAGDVLPLDGDKLLVETSYFNPPSGMDSLIDSIFRSGFQPLLAHPERYMYMGNDDYSRLKGKGVLFQLNITSLAGMYGEEVRSKAEFLLDNGYYRFIGTDLHRQSSFRMLMDARIRKKHSNIIEGLKR